MNIIGIIPARMASSRFPGKPLARICGMPMIGHVYYRSKLSNVLSSIYVATCDEEIAQYCRSIDAEVIMTSDKHKRASDRAAEAMLKIEKKTGKEADIVVMIQGDEPLLCPEMIDHVTQAILADCSVDVANLMGELKSCEEKNDPNIVKTVTDTKGFALYFSREPIPSRKMAKGYNFKLFKQIAIIPFRRNFLIKFNELAPTPLEIIESVDMLRVLEHGYKVKMVKTDHKTQSVDTVSDLKAVEQIMLSDKVFNKYKNLDK